MSDGLATRRFDFTLDKLARLNIAISCVAGVTLVAVLFVLLSSLWVYATPAARHILDRVSFRLLCWLMAAEALYALLFIVLYSDWKTALFLGSSPACGPLMWLHWGSMMAANWFCAAMAINLCLTVVFDINPIDRRLERWYVLVALFLGYGIPVIPMARGDFGREPNSGICYLKAPDKHAQVRELLLILYAWEILSCLITIVCVAAVLVHIFRQSRATGRIRASGHHQLDCDLSEYRTGTGTGNGNSNSNGDSPRTRTHNRPADIWHRLGPQGARPAPLGHLQDRFLEIALKVSVLPITMIVVISIVEGGNLYYLINHTRLDKRQYIWFCAYQMVYGGRGLPFAVIALFTDPSLRRGISAAWQARRQSATDRRTEADHPPDRRVNLLEMLQSGTLPSLDVEKALAVGADDASPRVRGTEAADTAHRAPAPCSLETESDRDSDASSTLPSPPRTLHFARAARRETNGQHDVEMGTGKNRHDVVGGAGADGRGGHGEEKSQAAFVERVNVRDGPAPCTVAVQDVPLDLRGSEEAVVEVGHAAPVPSRRGDELYSGDSIV